MKRINFQGQESERTQALREAELLSKVRHGHILNYIESFEDDECLNIVTEYCDGGDLEVYLRNRNGKSLPEVRVCHWMFQIASGLQVGYFFISYILGKEPALMGNCFGFCNGEKCDILVQRFVVLFFNYLFWPSWKKDLNIWKGLSEKFNRVKLTFEIWTLIIIFCQGRQARVLKVNYHVCLYMYI